jgi:DNA polymerase
MKNDIRERMLLDMGLGPLWKSRAPEAPAQGVPSPDIASPQVAATPARPQAVSGAGAPAEGAAPAAPSAARAQAGPLAPGSGVVSEAGKHAERAAAIARMDWPALRDAVAECAACGLCKTRKNTVFGVGDESADWMIIGEAPGAEEDARGEPFVGQAGQLLDAMLAALDMRRDRKVYIANVLKCRPPGNRNPEPGEVAQCVPHLLRQVQLVRPRVILLMGRFAAQAILGTDASIASLRGRRHVFGGTDVVVTYHPAYLLRTLADKSKAWEDLLFARSVAAAPRTAGADNAPPP